MILIKQDKILMRNKNWFNSQTRELDQFGNKDHTFFRIRARLNDGHIKWTGIFYDRDDFDDFLDGIARDTLKYDRYLWNLPLVPWSPDIGDYVTYEFASVNIFTSSPGSTQTVGRPVDWNDEDNSIECIGGGASGGLTKDSRAAASGGGGGAYAKIVNYTALATNYYSIGNFGASQSSSTGTDYSGLAGTATWFGPSGSPVVSADFGKAGIGGGNNLGGVSGGTLANSIGTTLYKGGNSGSANAASPGAKAASGGGGAGQPTAAGGDSAAVSTSGTSASDGGSSGGIGGAFSAGAVLTSAENGGAGTEWVTVGSGGGGGGLATTAGTGTSSSGAGGNYGGGGGGTCALNSWIGVTGEGGQGLLVVTYSPKMSGMLMMFN